MKMEIIEAIQKSCQIKNVVVEYCKTGYFSKLIIKPIYLFTDGKKDEYYEKKKIVRSPLVKKINFLETILDDDIDNY